jgi:hypothetical protein
MKVSELSIKSTQQVEEGLLSAIADTGRAIGGAIARTGVLGSNARETAQQQKQDKLEQSLLIQNFKKTFAQSVQSGRLYRPDQIQQSQQGGSQPVAESKNALKNFDLFESVLESMIVEYQQDPRMPAAWVTNYINSQVKVPQAEMAALTDIATEFQNSYIQNQGKFPDEVASNIAAFILSVKNSAAADSGAATGNEQPDTQANNPEQQKQEQQLQQQEQQYITTATQALNKLKTDPSDAKSQLSAITSIIYLVADDATLVEVEKAIKTMRDTLAKREAEKQRQAAAAQPQGTSYEIGSKKAAPANNDPTSGGQQFGQRGIAGMNESKIRRKRAV